MTLRQSVIFQAPFHVETVAEPLPLLGSGPGAGANGTLRDQRGHGVALLSGTGADRHGPRRHDSGAGGRHPLSPAVRLRLCRHGRRMWATGGPRLAGRRVFAFQPHTSHFAATPADLLPVPDGLRLEQSVMVPSMETAVNLVMDGGHSLGTCMRRRVGCCGAAHCRTIGTFSFGQPDGHRPAPFRRALALRLGATAACAPVTKSKHCAFRPRRLVVDRPPAPVGLHHRHRHP